MAKATRAPGTSGQPTGKAPTPDTGEQARELTPAQRKAVDRLRRAIERDLDRFIAKVVGDEPAAFTGEDGYRCLIAYGRETRAIVLEIEGQLLLNVESVVMPLPADRDLILPLMRDALEFNDSVPGYARLAISKRSLNAVVLLPATHISRDDIERCLDDAGLLASIAADRFVRRYGGTTRKRARAGGKAKTARRRD